MQPGMQAGDDPSLDGAVAAITAKLRGGAMEEKPDKRENREDRDDLDRQGTNDLDESDARARQSGDEEGESQQADAETEGAEKAEDDADAFIELPAAEEGGEPERIPASEAAAAFKQLRQMNGDIATAVIKAEEEAFQKHDQITQALTSTFNQVANQAKVALQMMHAYAPPPPDPVLLDENSGYYDPAYYHKSKIQYDSFVAHYNKVLGTLKQAEQGQVAIGGQQGTEYERRELDRTGRFIPEFKDPATRQTRKAEILDTLGKTFGVTQQELDEIVDHKAWRMMDRLDKALRAEKKAPEVKKHLQETKPKIVNGRVSQVRDSQSGQFVSKARQEHAKSGTEESFARLLMRSGALKNF